MCGNSLLREKNQSVVLSTQSRGYLPHPHFDTAGLLIEATNRALWRLVVVIIIIPTIERKRRVR
jgi:hypothetical protein